MATILIPCTICTNKNIGIFKCQGCLNVFCRKHAFEHRDDLTHQLDLIVNEHDQLCQLMNEEHSSSRHLINEVDQWERNSIIKIQQVAQDTRQDITKYITSQKVVVSETLKQISERFRKAHTDDDFVENDLHVWKIQLENLKKDLTTIISSIKLCEESNETLINNIHLSLFSQQVLPNEKFLHYIGDIHIEDNGQLAMHGDKKRSDTFLCGQNTYAKGKHKVRFIINKTNSNYITTFGISSVGSQSSVYGWSTDDQTVGNEYSQSNVVPDRYDMKGETIFQIELSIDCDNRKLSYLNERTRCIKEIDVDVNVCSLPWQLYFYLYDTDDRVRLLSMHRI